jgi:hypothetical protein
MHVYMHGWIHNPNLCTNSLHQQTRIQSTLLAYTYILFTLAGCSTNVRKRDRCGPQVHRCSGGGDTDYAKIYCACVINICTHGMYVCHGKICCLSTIGFWHLSHAYIHKYTYCTYTLPICFHEAVWYASRSSRSFHGRDMRMHT